MNNVKKLIAGGAVILLFASASMSAFAASTYKTPAEAAAGVTGKTLKEVVNERQNGKTYGEIALAEGKLEEFKQEIQDIRKDQLEEDVEEQVITQQQADDALKALEEQQALCNGNAAGGIGRGCGQGQGLGRGQGRGLRNGYCMNP